MAVLRNAVLSLRRRLTPYEEMARTLPSEGRILDLACGWGLLSFALCRGSRDRRVIGIDHDADRVRLATEAAQRLPAECRPRFELADVSAYLATVARESLDGIAMIDMLHYFDATTQQSLVDNAARALRTGGVLVARDVDAADGMRGGINMLYERLATGSGFTKSASPWLVFRARDGWTKLIESAGFSVKAQHSGPPFLADVLFTGVKKK